MHTWIVTLAALPLACISSVAISDPITYDFTVTAIDGPLAGDVSDGSFTFNSSIVPRGPGILTGPLLTSLSFTWDGITYNSSTANTGGLGFDGGGNLASVLFGDFCDRPGSAPGSCSSGGGSETWFVSGSIAGSGFAYAVPSSPFDWNGTVSFSPALSGGSTVPEPSTLALFGLGLAGMLLVRRSRKSWRPSA